MQNEEKRLKASQILDELGIKNYQYIEQGAEGVIFHDDNSVYKVHLRSVRNRNIQLRRLSFFLDIPICEHIYKLEEINEYDGCIIEKYRFEESVPCAIFSECEAIEFLTECWQLNLVVFDCKPKNFIRVNGVAKLVDLNAREYSDNLFLNACVRMYLYVHFYDKMDLPSFKKLLRSAFNNFDLPELEGARDFVNKVFANIIFQESSLMVSKFANTSAGDGELYSMQDLPNLETLFWTKIKENKYLVDIRVSDLRLNDELYFEPQSIELQYQELKPLKEKVSLLIKTCAQDEFTIEANIKHIVKQLSAPNPFYEIVVSIDTREGDFLRQYNSKGSVKGVTDIIEGLVKDGIIDRYFLYDNSQTEEINRRWFGIPSKYACTSKKCIVSSTLYAFEQCKGDYILQMDCDVIIGRKDFGHSFLTDMIAQLEQNQNVISVGFNIYNKESKDYFGFENGGFVPEVRLGLFDKKRLFSLRPYSNELEEQNRLKLSWYRAIERFQERTGYCSVRGGDQRSFYVHPQNYRKTESYSWLTVVDRVEQLQIPNVQYGGFDCEGSFYEWCSPKRNEKMVVISCFRNVSIPRFLRFWCSLMSQSFQDFGVVLFDDCSDNGLPMLIRTLIREVEDRVTFVSCKTNFTKMQCIYQAIHYFCNNDDSVIAIVDGDDALIGKDALRDLYEKYSSWDIDVAVGKVWQKNTLSPYYDFPVNFVRPRNAEGGNVWQDLKSFKKYLFDSIPLPYFKTIINSSVGTKLYKLPWIESYEDYAIMIPIVEMSRNPMQLESIGYFKEKDREEMAGSGELKEQCIAEILSKPALSPKDVFRGRKKFRPTFDKIEIDITYDCNLKCFGCNRSCAQKPTKEQLEISAIEGFIKESIMRNKQWKLINVLGGEPTLHKDFLAILELLQNYVETYSPGTVIQVVSNGISEKSRNLCEQAKTLFKNVVIDYGSYKTSNNVEYFTPFNDAPIDDEKFSNADYSKACWVAEYCGILLNSRGYFACAVCGSIARVLDEHTGMRSCSELTESELFKQYSKYCPLCGNYKHYSENAGNFIPRCEKEPFRNIISKSWEEIYGL